MVSLTVTRLIAALGIAISTLVALGAGDALAAFCINTAKPDGAGNFGDVVVDADEQIVSVPTNPGGQTAGGFVDVYVDVNEDGEGDFKVIDDTFVLNNGQPSLGNPGLGDPAELPHGAHNAGPGDDLCDGVGLDDVTGCEP